MMRSRAIEVADCRQLTEILRLLIPRAIDLGAEIDATDNRVSVYYRHGTVAAAEIESLIRIVRASCGWRDPSWARTEEAPLD